MTIMIPICVPPDSDSAGKVEWVMLELNGELQRPIDETLPTSQVDASSSDGAINKRRVELGSLNFDSDGNPTLIIGNHELKGSVIKLKEPFAILRKKKSRKLDVVDDNKGDLTGTKKLKSKSGVQLELVGVVTTKLMFDQYPKTIMR